MPKAKRSTSSTTTLPWAKLFVADDIRLEQGGKPIVIGLYSDNVIVAQLPPHAPAPSSESPLALDGFSLLVALGGFEGRHDVILGFEDTKAGFVEMARRAYDFPSADRSLNIIVRLRPFVTESLGVKQFQVSVDGWQHRFAMEIRQAPVVETPPVVAAGRQPGRSTKGRRPEK